MIGVYHVVAGAGPARCEQRYRVKTLSDQSLLQSLKISRLLWQNTLWSATAKVACTTLLRLMTPSNVCIISISHCYTVQQATLHSMALRFTSANRNIIHYAPPTGSAMPICRSTGWGSRHFVQFHQPSDPGCNTLHKQRFLFFTSANHGMHFENSCLQQLHNQYQHVTNFQSSANTSLHHALAELNT